MGAVGDAAQGSHRLALAAGADNADLVRRQGVEFIAGDEAALRDLDDAHDGPGIRTTVFLKGCGMHCPWCANPESWGREAVLMHDARVCTRCGACARTCRTQAITIQAGQWHYEKSRCTGCQDCAGVCLQDAIRFAGMNGGDISKIVPAEIIPEVKRKFSRVR